MHKTSRQRVFTPLLVSLLLYGGLSLGIGVKSVLAGTPEGLGTPPVRIGATVSLSGKYREPSAMIAAAFRLWEQEVNRRGGLLGRPVQLLLEDDQGRPEVARRLYEKLICEDRVDLVFSP